MSPRSPAQADGEDLVERCRLRLVPETGKPAIFKPRSPNAKLSRLEQIDAAGQDRRLITRAPFVSATAVSISATCPTSCPFKDAGCYAQNGHIGRSVKMLDAASVGLTAEQVIAEEVRRIDRSFHGGPIPQDGGRGGRDLRLHVAGDAGSAEGARLLAGAANRWRHRGGGAVWSFTHLWQEIPRHVWGRNISVLASVEGPEEIEVARAAGYASSIVVPEFQSEKAFRLPGSDARIIPCPAETKGKTCVECRLCLNADRLFARNSAIAFAAHGPDGGNRARNAIALSATTKGRREAQSVEAERDKKHDAHSCASGTPSAP